MVSGLQLVLLLAASIWTRVLGEPSPLSLDLVTFQGQNNYDRLARRSGPVLVDTTDTNQYYYYAVATVGTPPQQFKMFVATNVGDVMLNTPTEPACNNGNCDWAGKFYPNASSTYSAGNQNFSFYYDDGYVISGHTATDVFRIGGQNFTDMEILIGTAGNVTDVPLGIGYNGLEATTTKYANLPVLMYNQQLSNIIGFSLYFNHSNSTVGGRLAFGGVDTTKFYNTLETLPISMANLQYGFTTIDLASVTVFDGLSNHTIANSNMSVLVDSATSGCSFPTAIFKSVIKLLNATWEPDADSYVVPLTGSTNPYTTVDLLFGSTTIKIPIYDFFWETNGTHGALSLYDAGTDYNVLGLPFFENAYTVFDFSHNQISLAPLVHEFSADNVTMISQNGVQGLVGVLGNAGNYTNDTLTTTGNNTNNVSSGGLSTGAKVGIGVGVGVGVPLLLAAIAIPLFLRRRKNQSQPAQAPVNEMSEANGAHGAYGANGAYGAYGANGHMQDNRESYGYKSELPGDRSTMATTDNSTRFTGDHSTEYTGDRATSPVPYSPPLSPNPMSTSPSSQVKRKPVAPAELPS